MRIVAVSDLHGHLPAIPSCDLLIIAGDLCPDIFGGVFAMSAPERQAEWFDDEFTRWIDAQPARHRVVTWGNHDWCGELPGRFDHVHRNGHNNITLLVDDVVEIDGLRIWASPWSNTFGQWAFMKPPAAIAKIYAQIPEGVDILVSHQPPRGHCDLTVSGDRAGSRELRATLDRVRPKVVVCGHIHEGHGRSEREGISILNASLVDEFYRPIHGPTTVEF